MMGLLTGRMTQALGEMTTLFPVSGAFTHYAARFVDPALGFSLGYNYWSGARTRRLSEACGSTH